MRKKLFTFLFAIVAGIGLIHAEIHSGNCGISGDNLQWSLDTETGLLNISGIGMMENFTYKSYEDPNAGNAYMFRFISDAPWFAYTDEIRAIIINEGVTSIGNYAFLNVVIDSLVIPSTIKKIGCAILAYDRFHHSKVKKIIYSAVACDDFEGEDGIGGPGGPGHYILTPLYFLHDLAGVLGGRPYVESFVIGENVQIIPAWLCHKLGIDVDIPCSVNKIGYNAFNGCNIKRNCAENTVHNFDMITLCKKTDFTTLAQWIQDTVSIGHTWPNISGTYSQIIINSSYDTIINEVTLTIGQEYNIMLPDTILCYDDDLVFDGIKCSLTKKANVKQLWSYTLQTAQGCDSTVTINVTWRKLPDFTITTRHEYDTYNSGSISYQKANANYSGKYYYTLNGEKGRSLSNLPAGTYRLVFYSEECGESVEKTVQIYQYGMKVNNQYYLLDTENHTATLTYRGTSYSDYSNEYSGNITIPESITFNGQEYKVTGIGASAFSGCNVTSVTMTSQQPVTVSNSCGLGNTIVYVPFGSLADYKKASNWSNYNLHVINPSHSSCSSSSTSTTITLGNDEEAKHIASCGMEGGEEFAGNVIEYIGLEPNSEYADVPFFVKTKEGDYDNIKATFKTTALTLTTLASKAVSNTISILLAETNMSDSETSCGFEWRRNDQPADMPSNQVLCPVANGLMAGRLKGLKDDVYYKYRAFYKSAAGNMFYGDWQYVFTGDVTVEFDPVLYTYAAQFVSERKATLKGYALAGSEDFTEQGFEYWAESRRTDAPARRAPQYAIGEKHTVTGTGISMRVTLEDLDEGTVYKYRTYAKVGGKTLYGAEMTFTTQGTYEDPIETGLDLVPDADADETDLTPTPRTPQARKYLRNGILYIEHNGITYTAQGHRID